MLLIALKTMRPTNADRKSSIELDCGHADGSTDHAIAPAHRRASIAFGAQSSRR